MSAKAIDIVAAEPVIADDTSDNEMKGEVDPREIYIDPIAQGKLIRKVDLYVIPLLNLCWIFAYLDRSNIGNAAIAGMPADLSMSTQDLASELLPHAHAHGPSLGMIKSRR
jgi:hypothetical protein